MSTTDTHLRHSIANSINLRLRAESVIKHRLATTSVTVTERDMLESQPSGFLLWAIASNATVLAHVKTYLAAPENAEASLDDALDSVVPDGDLEFIVLQEVTCLA